MSEKILFNSGLMALLLTVTITGSAQMITGVWTGKINRQKVEVKIIQKGDSLTGTSYYGSPGQYKRYRIKGYFDMTTNEAVWWDDVLVDEKPLALGRGRMELLSRADFNCPGSGKMTLDGRAGRKNDDPSGEVHLTKVPDPTFNDEWDYVIENYTNGGNDPELIERIEAMPPAWTAEDTKPIKPTTHPAPVPQMNYIPPMPAPVTKVSAPVAQTIEEKFTTRKKTLVTEIPLTGDSIELRFFDNAEIDGDSISLFLNDELIYRNIRLTGNAYTIKLAVKTLKENSELVMVAENLGSIPPNTSLMVAVLGDKRYEARLESTEGSSAMVRFRKPSE